MHIWVDADACPKVIKEILFRAANRVKLSLTLIANQTLAVPPSPYIRSVQVAAVDTQASLAAQFTFRSDLTAEDVRVPAAALEKL